MFHDNAIEVDLQAMRELLGRADVLAIGFPAFAERLLIDTRSNQREGPLVTIVGPVSTVQERYMWLGQHRGAFGAPEAFSFFVWPKSVSSLTRSGELEPMRRRLALGRPEAAVSLDDQLAELDRLEHAAMLMAIRGDGPWKPLWERRGLGTR